MLQAADDSQFYVRRKELGPVSCGALPLARASAEGATTAEEACSATIKSEICAPTMPGSEESRSEVKQEEQRLSRGVKRAEEPKRRKRLSKELDELLQSRFSILASANLAPILNWEKFSRLTPAQKKELATLLPENDRRWPSASAAFTHIELLALSILHSWKVLRDINRFN